MGLALELENLDGLDDGFHSAYKEENGVFKLDIDGGIPDTSVLQNTLKKERDHAKDAEKKLKASEIRERETQLKLDSFDIDKYNETIASIDKLEADRLAAEEQKLIDDNKLEELWSGRMDKKSSESTAAVEAERANTEAEKTLNAATQAENNVLKDLTLQGQISMGVGGIFHEHALEDAVRAAERIFTLDDSYNAVIKDSDGNILPDVTVTSWANSSELKAKKPHWFLAQGSGSGATQQGAPQGQQKNTEGMSAVDRLTLARSQKK